MRLKLIGCEVLYREICYAVARSPNTVDVEFLTKGLHDLGARRMREILQQTLDRVDEAGYDAIVFAYASCNYGLVGLTARSIPLVIPRAHDCITLFLGSKERYARYFTGNPGVYFQTTGWIERGAVTGEVRQLSIQRQTGMDSTYEELEAKYGAENARFLYETLCDHTRHYSQLTFIEMGVEPDGRFERQVEEDASRRGWRYEKVQGDLSLLMRLVDGTWEDDGFLTIPPGYRIAADYGEGILAVEKADPVL